jgi:hypothetical protein
MDEQAKIEEARYFLGQICATVNHRDQFNHNLSAFLSAARSCLQYAHKEASAKPGGQAWYDGQVAGKPVAKFFKDKRDINIHVKPVKPSAKIAVSLSDHLFVSDSVSFIIQRKDGTIEMPALQPAPPPPPAPTEPAPSVQYQYFFQDWLGHEDVITACELYINEVQAIVSDGNANGFVAH